MKKPQGQSRGIVPWQTPFDDFFDMDMYRPSFFGRKDRDVFPKIDVHETKKEIIVTADIPGISPENINIDVTADTFSISGSVEETKKEEDDPRCWIKERYEESFNRSFTLPSRVDSEKVKATFKNGTLKIRMPKASEALSKKITVEMEK